MITKNINLEELVDRFPTSIRYLRETKIKCIMCGESTDCTLEEACIEKNIDSVTINRIVIELNKLYS